MPEISVIHIAILFVVLIAGIVIGWIFRGGRSAGEKTAINLGWQEQLEAQRNEHERLLEQNKSLMDQNSQYQASNKDAKMRASELSDALKDTFERRDELQRQIKDIRGNLEVAVSERDQLQNDMESQASKDEKIERLGRELENWQERLPPLIERFRQRNADAEELEQELASAQERFGNRDAEAEQLERELAAANARIAALEGMVGSEQTRIEPVDQEALQDGMDPSNDPVEESKDAVTESHVDGTDGADRDNLKQIKGVGPAIEKTLNEIGIFRFNQIAEMSEYDIDRVAQRLKGFHSRIYREDWIGQARDLQDHKVSGRL